MKKMAINFGAGIIGLMVTKTIINKMEQSSESRKQAKQERDSKKKEEEFTRNLGAYGLDALDNIVIDEK